MTVTTEVHVGAARAYAGKLKDACAVDRWEDFEAAGFTAAQFNAIVGLLADMVAAGVTSVLVAQARMEEGDGE